MCRHTLISYYSVGSIFLAAVSYGQATSTLCHFDKGPRAAIFLVIVAVPVFGAEADGAERTQFLIKDGAYLGKVLALVVNQPSVPFKVLELK